MAKGDFMPCRTNGKEAGCHRILRKSVHFIAALSFYI
jgi:hypothetical protein